jgi:hypothetical protein
VRDDRAPTDVTLLPGWWRAFALAVSVGAAALLAGGGVQGLLYETRAMRAAQLSAAVCGAVLLLAVNRPLDAAARSIGGARGPVAAWLGLSVGALALGLAVLADLLHALGATWRFSDGDPRLWECEPEALGVSAVVLLATLGFARARLPHRRTTRGLTVAVGALALVLAGAVGLRAARRPAIHRMPAQPVMAVLPEVGQSRGPRDAPRPPRVIDQAVTATDLVARRYDVGDGRACALRLARRDARASLPTALDPRGDTLVGCGTLAVQRDPSHGGLVVSGSSPWSTTRAVFDADGTPWTPTRAVYASWASEAAAPGSWLLAALTALAAALAVGVRARESRGWGARSQWREGELGRDGVITVSGDGARVVAPFGAALSPGPVVLRTLAPGDDSPFRGTPRVDAVAREDVRAGTAASVAVMLEAEADARAAFALYAALLAVATLAPLWAVGLAP